MSTNDTIEGTRVSAEIWQIARMKHPFNGDLRTGYAQGFAEAVKKQDARIAELTAEVASWRTICSTQRKVAMMIDKSRTDFGDLGKSDFYAEAGPENDGWMVKQKDVGTVCYVFGGSYEATVIAKLLNAAKNHGNDLREFIDAQNIARNVLKKAVQ